MSALLALDGLSIGFGRTKIVQDLSLSVAPGEALGIVGESGSGKSLSMLALLQLLPAGASVSAGSARFDGTDLLRLKRSAIADIRGRRIGFVFQDPLSALNPVLTVGRQIAEVVRRHFGGSRAAALARAEALLAQVGVPDPPVRLKQYPHEFSGGMRQRVTIAMALAGEPELLIADEPTTALDVTVQAEIVALVKRLQRERGMAVIWVTHDLALLARIADRVVVMYAGRLVEEAPIEPLFAAPKHPYTKALLASLARQPGGRLSAPSPTGCPFAGRCPEVMARCTEAMPALADLGAGRRTACWQVRP
jgi:peptide/nickel transport system ATP-binding protein/oligopeptide transport system ATP-binding protein